MKAIQFDVLALKMKSRWVINAMCNEELEKKTGSKEKRL